ncbi:dihydroxyacetone kinase subunit DhaK [Niallia sp. FSL W8-0635]|uniref:dihydroxyacetone kinase subunit DhaK n=1 Tax=Niallia sp. FSL W8-0635 TaxID=2975337 RepID=UPI0030FCCA69
MKKLINDPTMVVSESLEGFMKANQSTLQRVEGVNGIIRKNIPKQGVRIVTGGGSGHEPSFLGLVGEGMASGAALGNVFTSPDPLTILTVLRSLKNDDGILCLVINYAGDTMNFGIAAEMAAEEGIKVSITLVTDDIASAPIANIAERRGVAGVLLVLKIVGAASEKGYSLEEVTTLAEKANRATRTLSIALAPCSLPGSSPNFSIDENEYEFGMGIHGEPGIETKNMALADEIVEEMLTPLIAELQLKKDNEVIVLINGTGATTDLELNIVNRKVTQLLEDREIIIHDSIIGSYCTSLEMAGVSISLLLLDDTLKEFYDAPAYTPSYYKRGE